MDANRPTQARRSNHGPALWTGERNEEEGQEERSGVGDVVNKVLARYRVEILYSVEHLSLSFASTEVETERPGCDAMSKIARTSRSTALRQKHVLRKSRNDQL